MVRVLLANFLSSDAVLSYVFFFKMQVYRRQDVGIAGLFLFSCTNVLPFVCLFVQLEPGTIGQFNIPPVASVVGYTSSPSRY